MKLSKIIKNIKIDKLEEKSTFRARRTCVRELKIKQFCIATFHQENEMNLQAGEYKPKVVVMCTNLSNDL